jgi:hypothetical protein
LARRQNWRLAKIGVLLSAGQRKIVEGSMEVGTRLKPFTPRMARDAAAYYEAHELSRRLQIELDDEAAFKSPRGRSARHLQLVRATLYARRLTSTLSLLAGVSDGEAA